ncbi:hypothetical protein B9J07_27750 [Sinorhizobium sp. LM21]|uniref:hypothetical protein n=1 Tax=Sinorhizobium sp. LM21 TaxID=1449788 RepID=UPI0005D8999B|nr:hypothetical protein [Sinorhizobium sp. LM21]AJW30212.1 hypothetical protein pLM21S1_p92 [Sinorhizobium sp. LM21]OWZ90384.1 hypothetical protein B9J07_27750 [Sinorhizobium sp. LM21]
MTDFTALDLMVDKLRNPLRCRKDEIIKLSVLKPHLSDPEMAQRLLCTVSTVRKWRSQAHHYGVRVENGDTFYTVRLKKPVYAAKLAA